MAGILENGELITRFVVPMTISSNKPVFVMDTLSLRRQTVSQGSQRWEISTNLEPSNNSADLLVHSVINGVDSIIDIQMPQVYRRKGATTTTSLVTVTEDVSASFSLVPISNNNGVIRKGEFIKFTNHDKVYLVIEELSGDGYLKIFPNLIHDVELGSGVKYGDNVIFKARYDTDSIQGIVYIDGIMSDQGTVKFIEAF